MCEQRQTMIVTGNGAIHAEPDQGTIQIGITTHAEQLTDAQAENAERSKSVVDRLTSLGIQQSEIQTSHFSVAPQYDYIDGQQRFRNYEVQHQLHVTVKDISKIGEIIDAAVQSGATEVSAVQFGISNSSELYERSLSKAVQKAHTHAEALAHAAEVVLQQVPLHIQEEAGNSVMPYPIQMAKMSAAPGIEPGTLEIQATVTVTYSYR